MFGLACIVCFYDFLFGCMSYHPGSLLFLDPLHFSVAMYINSPLFELFGSESCSIQQSCVDKWLDMPCLMLFFRNTNDDSLDSAIQILADIIHPVLLQTVIKGIALYFVIFGIWFLFVTV